MPATTRSQGKQTHLEDYNSESAPTKPTTKTKKEGKPSSTQSKTPSATVKSKNEPNTSSKRKQPGDKKNLTEESRPAKKQKQKQASIKPDEDVVPKEQGDTTPVLINRAPVLQLWGACVSEVVNNSLSWETHLSVGSAISTLCAVSKGRAIGTVEQPSDDIDKKAEKDRKKRAAKEDAEDEVHVMGFKLLLKDGNAIVSGKPQKSNEAALKKKFGEEEYERVKETMQEAVSGWKNEVEELNYGAFHMYEKFRPNVQRGQGGWGKKGELRMEKIREVVMNR